MITVAGLEPNAEAGHPHAGDAKGEDALPTSNGVEGDHDADGEDAPPDNLDAVPPTTTENL
jgi:hypothetical protein